MLIIEFPIAFDTFGDAGRVTVLRIFKPWNWMLIVWMKDKSEKAGHMKEDVQFSDITRKIPNIRTPENLL